MWSILARGKGNVILASFCLCAVSATTLRSQDASKSLANGVQSLRQGRTFVAIKALRSALAEGDLRAHLPLAEAYFVLNQRKLFKEEIALAKAAFPLDPEAFYVEGRYRFQVEKDVETAAKQFQLALVRSADHYKALCYLGICLREMRKEEEAEPLLLKSVQLAEQSKSSFYLPYQSLAEYYLQLNRLEEAESMIGKAVALAPRVAMNQFLLGKVAWAAKKNDVAMASLNAAIKIDPAFLQAYYLLSRVLSAMGDKDGANRRLTEFQTLKDIYGLGQRQ